MRTILSNVAITSLACILHAQAPISSLKQSQPQAGIQTVASDLLSSLNGRVQVARHVDLALPTLPKDVKTDELAFSMQDTQAFLDDAGKVWFLADRREHLLGEWPAVYLTSEDFFRSDDPGNPSQHWKRSVLVGGEAVFNALVATIPEYEQEWSDGLLDWLQRVLHEPLHLESDKKVMGDLRGRSLELRVPLKAAYFLDEKDQYAVLVDFGTRGAPEQVVYFPDSQRRPKLKRPPLRPNATDATKLVSEPIRKKIWNGIQAAKATIKPPPIKKHG